MKLLSDILKIAAVILATIALIRLSKRTKKNENERDRLRKENARLKQGR